MSAPSAPMGFNKLTCKSLSGAPTTQFEHLMGHLRTLMVHLGTAAGLQETIKGHFSVKFSREFGNNSALYDIISMRYCHNSALYEIISMRYCHNSALYEIISMRYCHNSALYENKAPSGAEGGRLVLVGAPKKSVGAPDNELQVNLLRPIGALSALQLRARVIKNM